jgi:hypothetical protein
MQCVLEGSFVWLTRKCVDDCEGQLKVILPKEAAVSE